MGKQWGEACSSPSSACNSLSNLECNSLSLVEALGCSNPALAVVLACNSLALVGSEADSGCSLLSSAVDSACNNPALALECSLGSVEVLACNPLSSGVALVWAWVGFPHNDSPAFRLVVLPRSSLAGDLEEDLEAGSECRSLDPSLIWEVSLSLCLQQGGHAPMDL